MSAATNWQSRYTPAQLHAHQALKELRARQKAQMEENLAKREAERQQREINCINAERAERAERDRIAKIQAERIAEQERALHEKLRKTARLSAKKAIMTARRVAAAYGVDALDILGPSRKREIVCARLHMIALMAKENHLSSIAEIARAVGRDHTSVMSSLRVWNRDTGERVRSMPPAPHRRSYGDQFRHVPSYLDEDPNPFSGWGS